MLLYKRTTSAMKNIIIIIIIFGLSYIANSQPFTITKDTININIKELIKPATGAVITHAVRHNNKYYCYFEERILNGRDLKYFFIISENGEVEHKIQIPRDISNTTYYDLFIRNDSIFTKTYMDHNTYYLDKIKLEWIKINEVDDMIYEDDNFYVTHLDFGEWGSTTWFKDKKTGKEYELKSSGKIVNKLDSVYYISSWLSILSIDDPRLLKQCRSNYYYGIVEKEHYTKLIRGTNSLLGVKALFKDSIYSFWDDRSPKVTIATSFVSNNKLFHLCVDSVNTYIAKLEAGNLIPMQIIAENFSISDWHYSHRCKIQNDNSQLLKFQTKKEKRWGFIEINGGNIRIRFLEFE